MQSIFEKQCRFTFLLLFIIKQKQNNNIMKYTAKNIAESINTTTNYNELIRLTKVNVPISQVKGVDQALLAKFEGKNKNEILEFDKEVKEVSLEFEVREEIQRLRESINNAGEKIKLLERELSL